MRNQLSWNIIKRFSSRKVFAFTFSGVVKEFSEVNPRYVSLVLGKMVKKGMLMKIARDTYHIIPLNEAPDTYVPDSNQVAKYLVQDQSYYIGYTSALKFYGIFRRELLDGSKNFRPVVFVVTSKQKKPAVRSIGKHDYRFVKHDISRFFGFESIELNHTEDVMVSDLEKTIVDIATRPQLCGGIFELGKALFRASERISQDKLLVYLARNKKKSAIKRVLFLTDLFALEWTDAHETMMKELGAGISLLDPSAPDQGRMWYRFGLKINVNPINIKSYVLQNSMQ